MTNMVSIDGSAGEGGGQVLRSALALSILTETSFAIDRIRERRKRPGLMRQHLTAARAAAEICGASTKGLELGSESLEFRPSGPAMGGDYHFAIGSAGSTMLVLQTILLPLLTAESPSRVVLEGGTHNQGAPPFEFIERAFVPVLRNMGAEIELELERPGFFPAGGGRLRVTIEPCHQLRPIELVRRGEIVSRSAVAMVANLSEKIARRELRTIERLLGWNEDQTRVETVAANGPGNVVMIEVQCQQTTEIATGFGRIDTSAERVGSEAAHSMRRFLADDVPVGRYLADQLLIPGIMAGGISYRTVAPSRHTLTNIEVIRAFTDDRIEVVKEGGGSWEIRVNSASPQGENHAS